jgi:hypothetical protein
MNALLWGILTGIVLAILGALIFSSVADLL